MKWNNETYIDTCLLWLTCSSKTSVFWHTRLNGLQQLKELTTFLGIVLDTVVMETRLPDDKLERMCNTISTWLKKKKATKKKFFSLVGLQQYATKVIKCSKPF